jgi:hypothetical protein
MTKQSSRDAGKRGRASDKAEIDKVFHTMVRNVVKYGYYLNHHARMKGSGGENSLEKKKAVMVVVKRQGENL